MKKSLGPGPLVVPTPAWVVGTYDAEGKANAMTAAWGGICCSRPPCLAVALQKVRHTYRSIMERKAFTVSVPSEAYVRETDYFGMASGRDVDKFAATGLTPVRSALVDAPYVGEFPMVVECRLLQAVEIGQHTQFIGEILDVKADESACDGDGAVEMGKILPIVYAPGAYSYHGIGRPLGRAFSVGKEIDRRK